MAASSAIVLPKGRLAGECMLSFGLVMFSHSYKQAQVCLGVIISVKYRIQLDTGEKDVAWK
jgi:hypothetical protein